jgi:mannosyl-oligosaccharide alpha-1,2-mannosidase
MFGKKDERLRKMYEDAMDGMEIHVVRESHPSKLKYLADWTGSSNLAKQDHLCCFAPGMLALGVLHGAVTGAKATRHMKLADELLYTCVQTYKRTATGIGPEFVNFVNGKDFQPGAAFYILRPETVESLFILYQITKNQKYRDWGWDIFKSIDTHCEL